MATFITPTYTVRNAQPHVSLDHLSKQLVDLLLPVSVVAAVDVVVVLLAPATQGCVQLERPQEVVALLEVRPDCVDLVDQVLHADDSTFACNTATSVKLTIPFTPMQTACHSTTIHGYN